MSLSKIFRRWSFLVLASGAAANPATVGLYVAASGHIHFFERNGREFAVDWQMSSICFRKVYPAPAPRINGFAAWVASWFNTPAPLTMADDEPIPTRASMLQRLKDPADQETWEQFHRTYRGLIHGVARRAGLSDVESQEVVQETLIAVARKMPEFRYDPAKDSFKGWLLQLTRWHIAGQFRERPMVEPEPTATHSSTGAAPAVPAGRSGLAINLSHRDDDSTGTATVERIPDPAGLQLTAIWDEEWEKHLVNTALARIKRQVNPAHYQIYYLHVILGKSVADVKRKLGVNVGQIYLAKHRVGALLKKEVRKLEAAEQ